jgi:hypothetical protein
LLKVSKDAPLFGELVLPVRFQENGAANTHVCRFWVHLGIGF